MFWQQNTAGPAALLVSKIIKIQERLEQPSRLKPKDGLDVLRLLRTTDTSWLAERLRVLAADEMAGVVTRTAMIALRSHGMDRTVAIGALAARAVTGLEDPVMVTESTVILIEDLIQAYDASGLRESGWFWQQNTFTGRLTPAMLEAVLRQAKEAAGI